MSFNDSYWNQPNLAKLLNSHPSQMIASKDPVPEAKIQVNWARMRGQKAWSSFWTVGVVHRTVPENGETISRLGNGLSNVPLPNPHLQSRLLRDTRRKVVESPALDSLLTQLGYATWHLDALGGDQWWFYKVWMYMLLASSSILLTADLEKVSCQGSLSFFPPHTSISSSEAERRNRISAVQRLRPNGVTWFYRGVTMVSPKRSKSWLCFSCKRQLIWLMANHSHRSTSWFLAKTLGQADSFGWNEWKASCWFMRCDFTIGHVFHRVSHFRSKIFKR